MQVVLVANSAVLPIVNFTIESIYEHLANINPVVHIIIPAVEKIAFQQKLMSGVHIIHEEDLLNDWTKDRISKFPVVGFPARAGWYLQQFLKIGFAQYTKDEDYLIWDADTIILKPIKIKNGNKYVFYSSTERHVEYFDTFYALTGMSAASKISFIAQGMPINVEWMLELLRHIEQRAGHHWK